GGLFSCLRRLWRSIRIASVSIVSFPQRSAASCPPISFADFGRCYAAGPQISARRRDLEYSTADSASGFIGNGAFSKSLIIQRTVKTIRRRSGGSIFLRNSEQRDDRGSGRS